MTGLSNNPSAQAAACQLAGRIALLAAGGEVPLVGLNGAQGSGKSTLAREVAQVLARDHGLSCAVLSLDDFYLTRAEREALAATVHPLCRTRGVPGTHDVDLMRSTIAALRASGTHFPLAIPTFDKLADDRAARSAWPVVAARPGAIILEGWCVGIRDTDLPDWTGPINALEQECDPHGAWFAWSRAALPAYERVWEEFALLASIEVAGLDTVIESRLLQEQGLHSDSGRPKMDRAAVIRFVQHYERYTRALWPAMRRRADPLFRRDADFTFTPIEEAQ